ncbi:L,D-transpeptidase family protein [Azospirillum sp. sgz302134]
MLNPFRTYARPSLRAGVAICLLAGLLVGPGRAAQAAAARDVIGSWITRLDQKAGELEAAPRVKMTKVGSGSVLKKGDGGLVDTVVPGPVQPSDAPAAPAAAPVAVAAPAPAPLPAPAPIAGAAPAAGEPGAAPAEAVAALPALPPPPPLIMKVRARSADRVGRLATRLIELGFLTPEQWTDSFDDAIEIAVRAFQMSEGLMPDGKVGEVTRQALDRTPAQAASLMRNAMASLRVFQQTVPDTVLLVNLPSQTVTFIDRGKLAFTMRAVVGRPSRQTPLLQDRVVSVTINPTWTVPPTVLAEDKLPNLRKKGNSGIKDAIVYLDGNEVAPESVNWWSVTPDRVRIVQRPGDDNALGRFRFNLTNGESIFLHGTNDPKLFERDLRAASSGCVRLADARMVAETLLRAVKMDTAAIDRQLESGKTKTVSLPNPVPVRFVYWTATVEAEGTVRVHPGIYDDVPTTPQASSAAPSSTPQSSTPPASAGTASTPKRLEPPKSDRPLPAGSPQATPAQPARAQSASARSAETRSSRAPVLRAAM